MGRMLEYLVRGKDQTPGTGDDRSQTEPAETEPAETEHDRDDCPFIEVGDPEKKLVGSPSVVSSPHPGRLGVPHPPHANYPHTPAADETTGPERASQTVQFERWVRPAAEMCPIAPEIVAYHHPADAVSRQYCQLLEQIWRDKNKPAVLLLRGGQPGTATTTVTLNLAVSCCFHHHRRVAVVGADFGQPEIRRKLGLDANAGLCDVIAGDMSLKDVVQKTAVPHLFAICEGEGSKSDDKIAEAASWVLNWLRQRFDLVLIAGPSIIPNDCASPWMAHTDGVLLVGEQSYDAAGLADVNESIDRAGGSLLGFIHTNIKK